MPRQLFAQKCSNSQEITKNIKMFEVPEHSAIGNRPIIDQNNCRWVNGAFWTSGPLSEDRRRKKMNIIYSLPKAILWL